MTTPARRGEPVPHNRWDLIRPAFGHPIHSPVAVVVPYFEQPESLSRMYAAVAAARLDPLCCELVVVDDGSRDSPPEPPPGFALPTRILHQPDQGCRPGAARNLGVDATDAELLVFLDSDTLPEPPTISRLAAWPEANVDALVVGRRGHVDLTGWTPAATVDWLDGRGPKPPRRPDPGWLAAGYVETGNLLDADDRSFRFVISAVMACHRSLYEDVGGFDATRTEYGGDDWEFASRAFNNGAVLVHDAEAVAWHDEPDWSARDGRAEVKNRESLWLAGAISEPSTRGPALMQRYPDTIAVIAGLPRVTDGQMVAMVHCLLAAVPDLHVHLPADTAPAVTRHVANDPRVRLQPPDAEAVLRARTTVDVRSPVLWTADGLRSTIAAVRPGGPGMVTIADGDRVLATVTSTRARARVRRAVANGLDEAASMARLFGCEQRSAADAGVHRLGIFVDLAGYFGGWSTP